MTAALWTGPPIGVRRPGMLAVSGCRPPSGADATPANLALFERILTDVRAYVKAAGLRVVHGGAEGVDQAAGDGEVWLPDYANYGRSAPKIRNAYVTTTERFCAWPAPWSRGTWDAIKQRVAACGVAGMEIRMVEDVCPADVRALLRAKGATWRRI
jgi:hypothetical protein